MSTDPALLVAIGGAMATLGTAIYLNRRRVAGLEAWAWGEARDETDSGTAGWTQSLDRKLDNLGEKIDEDVAERKRDHERVERHIRVNRRLVGDSVDNLVDALNEELDDADLDPGDVEPDWYHAVRDGDDAFLGDGGRPVDGDVGEDGARSDSD